MKKFSFALFDQPSSAFIGGPFGFALDPSLSRCLCRRSTPDEHFS
jgi:hypothetical protein